MKNSRLLNPKNVLWKLEQIQSQKSKSWYNKIIIITIITNRKENNRYFK